MYCSKTNGQSDSSRSSKIQCYCSSVPCHVVVRAKAKHDGGMGGRTDEMILIIVTHDNNNDNTSDPNRYCLTKS